MNQCAIQVACDLMDIECSEHQIDKAATAPILEQWRDVIYNDAMRGHSRTACHLCRNSTQTKPTSQPAKRAAVVVLHHAQHPKPQSGSSQLPVHRLPRPIPQALCRFRKRGMHLPHPSTEDAHRHPSHTLRISAQSSLLTLFLASLAPLEAASAVSDAYWEACSPASCAAALAWSAVRCAEAPASPEARRVASAAC